MIYLDHAATTPMLPEVWDAMRPFALDAFGNPASAHAVGRKARRALEEAREQIALILDALPEEIVFTSGATEANNLAIFGLAGSAPCRIISTPFEHPCVIEPLKQLSARGFEIAYEGEAKLGVAMLVNHETGAITEYSHWRDRYPLLHCDAAQAVGKIPISFRQLGAATLSASAHKFGGPKGIGFLIVKKGTQLVSMMFGGHQQQGRRPGTESPMLAVGMAKALAISHAKLSASLQRVQRMRDEFIDNLRQNCPPIVVNSPDGSSPYIVNISFPGCRSDVLLMKLDLAGIACSTGSACSSGSLLPSPVLQAMGVSDDALRSAMRFSFGASSSEWEVAEAASEIATAVNVLRST